MEQFHKFINITSRQFLHFPIIVTRITLANSIPENNLFCVLHVGRVLMKHLRSLLDYYFKLYQMALRLPKN